jgi:ABC-type dipeptide/oligopeptide/nickel transport system ATPase component
MTPDTSCEETFTVRDLVVEFPTDGDACHVLDGASLSLRPGEVMGLVGESGAGKSVLMWTAVGLTPPPGRATAGEISFCGEPLLDHRGWIEERLAAVRGSGIGLIVQNARAHLNPLARIGEQLANVAMAARALPRAKARELAVARLEQLALADPERTAAAYPHELSGGMAQRVLIAMATINSPRVLLADEPTLGLDVTIQAQVLDLLSEETRRLGASSLCLVTRDLGIVANYCDTVGVLHEGRVVEFAPTTEFFASPQHPHSIELLEAARLGTELALLADAPLAAGLPR